MLKTSDPKLAVFLAHSLNQCTPQNEACDIMICLLKWLLLTPQVNFYKHTPMVHRLKETSRNFIQHMLIFLQCLSKLGSFIIDDMIHKTVFDAIVSFDKPFYVHVVQSDCTTAHDILFH